MKTYWDHTEDERENLTSEQVTDLARFEHMEAGVIIPPEPSPLPDDEQLPVETEVVYGLEIPGTYSTESLGFYFRTREDAEAVAAMQIFKTDYDYKVGIDYPYAKKQDVLSAVVEKTVYRRESLIAVQDELVARKHRREEHQNAVDEYRKAVDEAQKASSSMWDDWQDRQNVKAGKQRVRDTFDTYLAYCEGNETIARRFLSKAFDADLIRSAIGEHVVEAAIANESDDQGL